MNRLERTDQLLLIAFLAVLAFPLLYAVRVLDNNTLTSWQWVFRQGGVLELFLLVAAVTIVMFPLSGVAPDPRLHPAILFLAALLAVMPLWNEPEVILDASRYFSQAKYLALHGPWSFLREWGGEIDVWTDLPAIPFVFGVAFRYLGESRTVIQGMTTLLFSLTVVSTYRIGRTLVNAETGLLAGLLLLGFPYLLTQVPLMLVDVPTMALITFSLDAFLCAVLIGGRLRALLAVALIVLAIFAKFSTWLMLPVLPVAAFVIARRGDKAAVRRSLLVLGASAVVGAALLAAQYQVIAAQLDLLREYQLPGLGRWRESTLSTFFFQIHPFVTLLAAYGVVTAVRKKEIVFLVPACFVLFVLLLRVERIRYMLPLFPLFALMASHGLRALSGDARVRRFTALSVAGASLVLVLFAYLPFLNNSTMANLRDAGHYLDSLPGEAVEVLVLPQHSSIGNTEAAVPLLDLFTRKRLILRQEPQPRPSAGKLLTSSLRFTWELKRPGWYAMQDDDSGLPLVVLSSGDEPFPPNAAGKRFAADTSTFRYKTVLTVLNRSALAQTAQ
ncbi:MAG: glycosyltransferase family 39 protein [Nitrospirota bacterium]